MNTDIKQAMHVEAGKSFGTAEANENERHWNDDKIERKNQDPTNHYDKSRMRLNFEIGPDGKIHPLGYQQKSLEVRLMDRLTELGWHPFKADSKIQPFGRVIEIPSDFGAVHRPDSVCGCRVVPSCAEVRLYIEAHNHRTYHLPGLF